LLVGTKKGGYIFRAGAGRAKWQSEGPHFKGGPVYHMAFDARDGKTMWAAINSTWGGPRIERSQDLGKTWKAVRNPIFREDAGMVLKRTWHIEPGHADEPDAVWAGTEPAALFKTTDGGEYWRTIDGLNSHPTRNRWEPGGGGLGLHSIAIDSGDARHIGIGISAGGAYESTDGGVTWRPWNEATKAKHLPEKEPTVGQCVHKLLAHPAEAGLFFMRNHEGVYWRGRKETKWTETTKGLPTDYGFAGAVHPRDAKTAYVIPLGAYMRMSTVEDTNGLAVYRTEDRGKTWKRLDRGLPKGMAAEVMREGMTTDRLDPLGVYFGTQAGELWASTDEGTSWERVAQYLPPILSVSAATI
jgi:photosystem II stability/assembly factor-like uncharacterized protein